MQNQLGLQAIDAGAFGGGREGVQQAELQGRALMLWVKHKQQGFNTALGAAQRQQQSWFTWRSTVRSNGFRPTTNGSRRYQSINGCRWCSKTTCSSQHLMHKDNLHYNNNTNLIKELSS